MSKSKKPKWGFDINNKVHHWFLLLFLALVNWVYYPAFSNLIHLRIFWIILALLDAAFWVVAYYPRYRWRVLTNIQRFVLILLSIRFCLYFLPLDILLQPTTQNFLRTFSAVLLVAIIFMGDKPRGGGGKDKKEGKNKRRWQFKKVPQES